MRIKGILFNPTETFREVESEGLGEAIKQSIVLAVIGTIIGWLVDPYLRTKGINLFISTVIGLPLGTLAVIYLFALFVHIFIYWSGGKQGVEQTLKAVMYATTPVLLCIGLLSKCPISPNLFRYAPMVGMLVLIPIVWSTILLIKGVKELQKISMQKAVLSVLVPVLLVIIAILLNVFTLKIEFTLNI